MSLALDHALRARAPLTWETGAVARRELADAFDQVESADDLPPLARLLGKYAATPFIEKAGDRPRPLVYRIGGEAALLACAARIGIDAAPMLEEMETARVAEAAKGGEP